MTRVCQCRNAIFLFFTLLTCYAYFLPRWASWNENSRLDLVLAIVDDRTLRIDRYYANTGDYAVIDGQHYSDKAPGAALLGVPVYAALRPLLRSAPVQRWLDRVAHTQAFVPTLTEGGSGVTADKVYFATVLYLVTCVTVSIPSALLGVVLYRHVVQLTGDQGSSLVTAFLYGLATPAFPFSTMFFSHQIVACLLFCGFHLLIQTGQQPTLRRMAVTGLMLGYAVITEYSAVLVVCAVLLYAAQVAPLRRVALPLAASMVPPLVLLMTYDWLMAGTVLPVGYLHSERYLDLHRTGFISLTGPTLAALWGITFGSFRGLFFVAPILLLALPGFVMWWRRGIHMGALAVCLWSVASFVFFNASSVMWQGGYSVGPRYVLPMLPFMAVALGVFVCAAKTQRQWRWLIATLGGWSWFVVWAETLGGQSLPDWTPSPLFNYSVPHLTNGNVARNVGMALGLHGVWSLAPLATALLILTLLWRCAGHSNGARPGELL